MKNGHTWIQVLGVAFTTALTLVACGGTSGPEPTPTLTVLDRGATASAEKTAAAPKVANGTFVLTRRVKGYYDVKAYVVGSACKGTGGYSDIAAGMEVTLLQDGKVIELSRIGVGKITKVDGVPNAYVNYSCTFEFSMPVPNEGEFFTLKMGRRGEQTFRREELLIPGALDFTIGD